MRTIILLLMSLPLWQAVALEKHAVSDSAGRIFYTGRITPPLTNTEPSREYLDKVADYPQTLGRDLSKLSEVMDQGPCGSCVYHGCGSTWMDTMILRGMPYLRYSPKWGMDCMSRDWGCGGSYAEKFWTGAVAKGAFALEKDYPYSPSQSSCRGNPQLYGKALSFKIINNSAKSIVGALNDSRAVAVTIGAGGSFMNYKTGVFSQCSSVPTNHQTEVVDYNLEGGTFDAQGNLPRGVGYWVMRNSWGKGWGDGGWIKIKMTDRNGRKCNNIADEASIVEVGDPLPPPPPPGPQVFTMDSPAAILTVTLSAGAKATVPQAKGIIQSFLDSWK